MRFPCGNEDRQYNIYMCIHRDDHTFDGNGSGNAISDGSSGNGDVDDDDATQQWQGEKTTPNSESNIRFALNRIEFIQPAMSTATAFGNSKLKQQYLKQQ